MASPPSRTIVTKAVKQEKIVKRRNAGGDIVEGRESSFQSLEEKVARGKVSGIALRQSNDPEGKFASVPKTEEVFISEEPSVKMAGNQQQRQQQIIQRRTQAIESKTRQQQQNDILTKKLQQLRTPSPATEGEKRFFQKVEGTTGFKKFESVEGTEIQTEFGRAKRTPKGELIFPTTEQGKLTGDREAFASRGRITKQKDKDGIERSELETEQPELERTGLLGRKELSLYGIGEGFGILRGKAERLEQRFKEKSSTENERIAIFLKTQGREKYLQSEQGKKQKDKIRDSKVLVPYTSSLRESIKPSTILGGFESTVKIVPVVAQTDITTGQVIRESASSVKKSFKESPAGAVGTITGSIIVGTGARAGFKKVGYNLVREESPIVSKSLIAFQRVNNKQAIGLGTSISEQIIIEKGILGSKTINIRSETPSIIQMTRNKRDIFETTSKETGVPEVTITETKKGLFGTKTTVRTGKRELSDATTEETFKLGKLEKMGRLTVEDITPSSKARAFKTESKQRDFIIGDNDLYVSPAKRTDSLSGLSKQIGRGDVDFFGTQLKDVRVFKSEGTIKGKKADTAFSQTAYVKEVSNLFKKGKKDEFDFIKPNGKKSKKSLQDIIRENELKSKKPIPEGISSPVGVQTKQKTKAVPIRFTASGIQSVDQTRRSANRFYDDLAFTPTPERREASLTRVTRELAQRPTTKTTIRSTENIQTQVTGRASKLRLATGLEQRSRLDITQSIRPIQTTRETQGTRQTLRVSQLQGIRQRQMQRTRQTTRQRIMQTQKTTRTPKPPTIRLGAFGLPSGATSSRSSQAFLPEVRIKGKFVSVFNKGLTKREATILGARVAKETSARSFRLKSIAGTAKEGIVKGSTSLGQFRTAKKDKGIFVEKSKFAIRERGEKTEITAKGLRALATRRLTNPLKRRTRRLF